ncbi:MAG TPA: MFS transporter [Tepidisphaeraceae bacterium]|nr:MFS transporter [Tepidisphaeraceae bacterium]
MTTAPLPLTIVADRTPPMIFGRLSVMMFLQFAIQGAWLPLLFGFLRNHVGIDQGTVGNILAVGAVGAMLSPLIAGQVADRYMNAERLMAICHIIGAGVVLAIAYVTDATVLYGLSFAYGLLYTPTLALVNSISFRHLPDAQRDFGKVRVWGTAGWIVVGIAMGHWVLFKAGDDRALQFAAMADAMKLSAALGIGLAVYSLTLPATPPSRGAQKFAPGEALKEIVHHRPLLTLFLLTFVVAGLHSFFFARSAEYLTAGRLEVPKDSLLVKIFGAGGGGISTIGQFSEVIVLALMPLVIKRVNRKTLFAVGLMAYAARFFLFAYFPTTWAIVPALALHGIVFGCFFFLVFITIDEFTTKDVRSSAQNVFNLLIFGFGVIWGNWFSGALGKWVTRPDGALDWQTFYAVPGFITLGCLVVLLVMYPRRAGAPQVGAAPR